MRAASLALVTYVWHYVVARLVYDQLLRPVLHGHLAGTALIIAVAVAGFLIGRRAGRHHPRRSSSRRRA